jgi:hypothetical protein
MTTLTEFLILQIATDEGLRNEVHLGECLIWDPVRSRCDCCGPARVGLHRRGDGRDPGWGGVPDVGGVGDGVRGPPRLSG